MHLLTHHSRYSFTHSPGLTHEPLLTKPMRTAEFIQVILVDIAKDDLRCCPAGKIHKSSTLNESVALMQPLFIRSYTSEAPKFIRLQLDNVQTRHEPPFTQVTR